MTSLLILSFLFWCIGFIVLYSIPACRIIRPAAQPLPSCSIIIPARNEEKNLSFLLSSLKNQSVSPLEILVCDDHSVDQTAQVAKSFGVTVVTVSDKPADWTGKTWALWQGANLAKGDLFLFLDADTRLETDGLNRMVNMYCDGYGMVTVQPFANIQRFYESVSVFFHLTMMAGVTAFTIFGRKVKPSGGFGPCLLCSRNDYFSLDGHRRVKFLVLENLALGREFQDNGGNLRCFGGIDTINFRMYPNGLRELIEGWSKGFASGAMKTRPFWMVLIILWISGMFQLIRAIVTVSLNPNTLFISLISLLYLFYMAQLTRIFRKIGNFGWTTVIFFPIYLVFFVLVYIWSFLKIFWLKSVSWKGRKINT